MRAKALPLSLPSERRSFTDLARGWLAATLLSGLPSTAWALISGTDALEPTRAAGSMLLPGGTSTGKLIAAAAVVHPVVSAFWALVLWRMLPRRATLEWALLAAVLIAMLDLEVIAPAWFPTVAALDFWPQLADHLMWGASFAIALDWRRRL
jgi:hypothetical protein